MGSIPINHPILIGIFSHHHQSSQCLGRFCGKVLHCTIFSGSLKPIVEE
ncbi:MAG: hypothetical protein IJ187_04615 [Neisseriaceae bacterium]|nr:hypothetical protein [Neisseriaceae bacterium]MBQ9183866.1 hypothetical protein [Neisseriaceae bacterium]MBQ9259113.1 hypothetical protein [Neisseriaceae bacterium]MBQ9724346.1 hypothetical protein [Neisseriaceae bacterium]MBR2251781.1 hypothetical protein [Neisseriaceae bacterium]